MHLPVLTKLSTDASGGGRPWFRSATWVISLQASGWLADLKPYERCRVVGVVKRLRVDPQQGQIEVTIDDGTGQVTARWAIRGQPPARAHAPNSGGS